MSVEHFYISHTQGISFLPSYSLLKAAGPQPCVNNHTEGLRGALTALQEAGRKGRWGRRRLQELSDGGWRGSKTLTHWGFGYPHKLVSLAANWHDVPPSFVLHNVCLFFLHFSWWRWWTTYLECSMLRWESVKPISLQHKHFCPTINLKKDAKLNAQPVQLN